MINVKTFEDFIRENASLSTHEVGLKLLSLSKEIHTFLINFMFVLKIYYGKVPCILEIMRVIVSVIEYDKYKQRIALEPKDN